MPRFILPRAVVLTLTSLCVICLPPSVTRAGEAVCKVIADNSVYSFDGGPDERTENVGKAKMLKIKGIENQPLLCFDLSPVPQGVSIIKGVLSVKLTKPDLAINQIGYSTVPTAWVEGTGASADQKQHAFSCFLWPDGGKTWAGPRSTILNATHGRGGNVNGWTLAKKVGERYEIELPGRVFEAIRADQPGGLLLMDDAGRWSGPRSNIFIYSREAGADGPVLTVTWGDSKDAVAPSTPGLSVREADVDDGGVLLEITCGGDDDAKGLALGYDMRLNKGGELNAANWEKTQPLPRYIIPRPKAAGEKIRLWVQNLEPGTDYGFGIAAYDEAGNRSAPAFTKARASGPTAPVLKLATPPAAIGGPRKVGEALLLWAADELSKIDPVSGKILSGKQYIDTKAANGNDVWNGKEGTVVLESARNEAVSFRLAVQKAGDAAVTGITLTPGVFKSADGGTIEAGQVRLLREWYLKSDQNWYGEALPVLNEKDGGKFDVPARDNAIPGQIVQTIYVEIQVPRDARPGLYHGTLAVAAGGVKGELPVALTVHQAVLPDELSFLLELNAYGQNNKDAFYAIHRLAHRFRMGYNTLGYGHTGSTSLPFIPKINGEGADSAVADWSQWDDWMGPLLDGSAFKDMPRGAVPIPHFYLPFYENYPASIRTEYLGGKLHAARLTMPEKDWYFYMCQNDVFVADGFSDKWKAAAKKIAADYVKHFENKGWTRTQFQIFANNKVFKGGNQATALWCLDEPSYGRDFDAIAFLYRSFQDPFKASKLRWTTRGDVSRPEWQGDRLDGACETNNVSTFYENIALIQQRRVEQGDKYWIYGGGGKMGADKDLAQLNAYYIKGWAGGADGGLAYWTSFHGNIWDKNDALAIVVGPQYGYTSSVTATGRLAAQRRAQQDVELLNLLAASKGWSRRQVAQAVTQAINLEADTSRTGADDPGDMSFRAIEAGKFARLRATIYGLLDTKN